MLVSGTQGEKPDIPKWSINSATPEKIRWLVGLQAHFALVERVYLALEQKSGDM
jgi:hypothetical protein